MMMFQLNYLAIFIAALAYWMFGALWFSVLVGKTWFKEIEKHGIKLKKPTKSAMNKKFIQTFILNLISAFGVAILLNLLGITCICQGFLLGILLGICFSAATIGTAFVWESRSLKLAMIDIGYPLIGITLCAIILTLWQ